MVRLFLFLQALGERIRPVLTINKIDRCFLELMLEPEEVRCAGRAALCFFLRLFWMFFLFLLLWLFEPSTPAPLPCPRRCRPTWRTAA